MEKTFKKVTKVPFEIEGNGRQDSLVIWNVEFDTQTTPVIEAGTSKDKREALIKIRATVTNKQNEEEERVILLANAQVARLADLKPEWIKKKGDNFELLVTEFAGISSKEGQILVK